MIAVENIDVVFSEQNFQKIIQYAPVGIVIIDKDLNWHLINQKFCDITGYSVRELEGMTFLDITYKEDINLNLSLYNQMIKGAFNEYFYEKRYVRKDGRIIWVKLSVAAVYLHGEYSHMVVSVQDIDESKKYQQEIETANRELDLLLYKASHDLKSPISSMEGLIQLMEIENPGIVKGDTFKHVKKTVKKLKRQNESMISLTQIADHNLIRTGINLYKFISGIAGRRHYPGVMDFSGLRNKSIHSDPFLLNILFKNLLNNSIRFNKSERSRIEISYTLENRRDVFRVRDNGPGIREEIRDKIFEMFYKGSESSAGMGLGLYLVKKTVQKLRGTIQVETCQHEGTTFIISLPSDKDLKSDEITSNDRGHRPEIPIYKYQNASSIQLSKDRVRANSNGEKANHQ